MAGESPITEAYVKLRAALDASFETDAKAAIGPAVSRIASDAALLWAGKKIFDFGKAGLDELKQAQTAQSQLNAVLQSTGGIAGVTAAHVDELSKAGGRLVGVTDENVKSAETVLLQFQNIRNTPIAATFDRASEAALNLSVRMGGDMAGAANIVGRALQNPEEGLARLTRVIGPLSASQKALITNFQQTGDIAGAQGAILDILQQRVGGAAQKYSETLPAAMARAHAALTETKGELVAGMAPALELTAGLVTRVSDGIGSLPGPLQTAVGAIALLGGGTLALARPINDVIKLVERIPGLKGASATAETVDATATKANAAAHAEAAVATEADTVATEENTAAHLAGGGGAGKFASALGKAGVVGAAVAATVGLYAYGSSLNKTTLDTQELQKVTQLGATDLGHFALAMLDLANKGGAFGGQLDDALKKLEGMGASGVGTIQRMRDAVAAAGGDTSKFDKALSDAKVAQDNLNTSTAAGNVVLGQASTEYDTLGPKILTVAEAAKHLTDSLQIEESEHQRLIDSAHNLFSAQQSLTQASKGVEQANRGVAEAQRGVEQANRSVADSYRGVEDAERSLTDAQNALNQARQGASGEDLGKGQLDLADANLRVADSQRAVNDAQKQVDKDIRLHNSPEKLAKDQDALTKAQDDYQRALYGVIDAQKSYNDLQQKGTDQDPAVVSARKQVDDATRSLADANQRVTDAMRGVSDAQQRVVDAKDQVAGALLTQADASDKLAQAQQGIVGGALSVNQVLGDQITALTNVDKLLAPGSPERQHLDDYITRLFVLAGIFQTTAPEFFGPGGGLTSAPSLPSYGPPAPGTPGNPTPPLAIRQYAAGGSFKAGDRVEFAEAGAAEMVAFYGRTQMTAPSDGFAFGSGVGPGSSSYVVNVYNPVPEPASLSVRHELARHSVLHGG